MVSVAIPVLNGARELETLLPALRAQRIDAELEILVADSESTDGSADVARRHGATVIPVPRATFSHGGTRNLLVERAAGDHVALLTQDATPATELWLAQLIGAFGLADDVGLAFGPGLPRPGASLTVRRELTEYFRGLAPDGRPRLHRDGRGANATTYFHSVNACLSRAAWQETPFRVMPYAEDRMLAVDMMRAGLAKAYVPGAAVVHSHDYGPLDLLRRSFDEWRGLREVAGHREAYGLRQSGAWIAGQIAADLRFAAAEGSGPLRRIMELPASARHACLRHTGAVLGSRAGALPPGLRRRLSLERRESFLPQAAQ